MTPIEALKKRRDMIDFNGDLVDMNYLGIENCIGALPYPVGIAGPIDDVYVPLATTESALVASVNRGLKYMSGYEVDLEIEDNGITRAPAFKFETEEDAVKFVEFIEGSYDEIKAVFDSGHLTMTDLQVAQGGVHVYLRFIADSSEAMGMNMITIAVDKVLNKFIINKSPVEIVDFVLSSNYCSDKKVSMLNIESGRGYKVSVSVRVPNPGLDLDRVRNVYEMKYIIGSKLAGCITSNGHVSNIITALFLVFGQDLGHVPDSSQAEFGLDIVEDDLVFTLEIHNLIVGYKGGGTDQNYVQQFFQFCKIGSKSELAELIAKVCLAGEISLFISLVEGTLAESHDRLRNRK